MILKTHTSPNYPQSTDEELVILVKKGDRLALAELFTRYQKPFYNLAYRISGDFHLADDITSEAFLRIYKYLPTFDLTKKFKPWAYKITTNVTMDELNKRKRRKDKSFVSRFSSEDDEPVEFDIPDQKSDPVEEVEKKEISEQVEKALLKISEKYRLPIYLFYFEELKYEQIAEILDIPINTVRTHLMRGKQILKKVLKNLI